MVFRGRSDVNAFWFLTNYLMHDAKVVGFFYCNLVIKAAGWMPPSQPSPIGA